MEAFAALWGLLGRSSVLRARWDRWAAILGPLGPGPILLCWGRVARRGRLGPSSKPPWYSMALPPRCGPQQSVSLTCYSGTKHAATASKWTWQDISEPK